MAASVLPADIHAALLQLLQGLQSTDNTLRSQAEEQLNTEWVGRRPDMLLVGLTEQMQASPEEGVS
jgi:importin-5